MWFRTLFQMTPTKQGIDINDNTAWKMRHNLRRRAEMDDAYPGDEREENVGSSAPARCRSSWQSSPT